MILKDAGLMQRQFGKIGRGVVVSILCPEKEEKSVGLGIDSNDRQQKTGESRLH
jgi:hypothetical protein